MGKIKIVQKFEVFDEKMHASRLGWKRKTWSGEDLLGCKTLTTKIPLHQKDFVLEVFLGKNLHL